MRSTEVIQAEYKPKSLIPVLAPLTITVILVPVAMVVAAIVIVVVVVVVSVVVAIAIAVVVAIATVVVRSIGSSSDTTVELATGFRKVADDARVAAVPTCRTARTFEFGLGSKFRHE
ncbi:hypothetical protein HZH68_016168 [Vespula germanica]|uniref:Uncharacterized protein n=1 Tax=Vespula germanica TaxID=30212 RepID=A0A834J460_VESGE|nr:hypothetical protein HZH68_016168 [Vespula germanica]